MDERERHRRLEELFEFALRTPSADREAFARRHAGDDPTLFKQLRAMLAIDEQDTSELDRTVAAPKTEVAPSETRFGRYRITRPLGEGGMGTVYLAEQEHPVRRRVALKIIRAGTLTERARERFHAERTALERLDHPAIARILDAGEAEAGRPYFAMEYVDGTSITSWAAEEPDLRQRLRLFANVCDGVQHAHQKGLVHRDLKPSNVLVQRRDGGAHPKIIDFGIALTIGADGTATAEEAVGSVGYMSPEQTDAEIDTRSDIFSLGALLHELVAGTPAFPGSAPGGSDESPSPHGEQDSPIPAADAMARHLRSRNPGPPPSLNGSPPELDWIIERALARDPGDRYASASELAEDLRRFLRGEATSVAPQTVIYRARLACRRHRGWIAMSCVALLALAIGSTLAFSGLVEARRHQQKAETARQHEMEEKAAAQAVTDFLTDTLQLAEPAARIDPDLTVRELLLLAGDDLDHAFSSRPSAELEVRRTLGRALLSLGAPDAATSHLLRALELVADDENIDPDQVYETLEPLWRASLGSDRYEANHIGRRASIVAIDCVRRQNPALGDALDRLLALPDEMRADATIRNLDALRRTNGPSDPITTRLVSDILLELGRFQSHTLGLRSARSLLQEAVRLRREVLTPSDPSLAPALYLYAVACSRDELFEDTQSAVDEAQRIVSARLPVDHWMHFACSSLSAACRLRVPGLGDDAKTLEEAYVALRESLGSAAAETILAAERLLEYHLERSDQDQIARYTDAVATGFAVTRNPPWSFARVRPVLPFAPASLMSDLDQIDSLVFKSSEMFVVDAGGEIEPILSRLEDSLRKMPLTDPVREAIARQLIHWSTFLGPEGFETRHTIVTLALRLIRDCVAPRGRLIAEGELRIAEVEFRRGRFEEAAQLAAAATQRFEESGSSQSDYERIYAQLMSCSSLISGGHHAEAAQLLPDIDEGLFTFRSVFPELEKEVSRIQEQLDEAAAGPPTGVE